MTRRWGLSALGLVTTFALAVPACMQMVIVLRDARNSGDGWTVTVDAVTDGPDAFTTGGMFATYHYAAQGSRFFQLRMDLRNDVGVAREFNFDRCDLDDGNTLIVPTLISSSPIVMEVGRNAVVGPGRSISRILIFSYPRGRSPTRLSCAPMVFRLPAIAPR